MSRIELSAVVLCYQAGEAIHRVIDPLYEQLEASGVAYELVLVANQWPDRPDPTGRVVEAFAAHRDAVRVVMEDKRGAMGWDMRSGLAAARGDYTVVIDGDAQNPVEDVLRMHRQMKESGVDVMKGRRIARFDGPYRRVISTVYNLAFTLLFGTRGIWDVNGKPKGLTRAAYEALKLESDDWFIDAEIVLSARRQGLAITEMPVVFHRNEERDSFVRPSAILEFLRNMARQRFRAGAEKRGVTRSPDSPEIPTRSILAAPAVAIVTLLAAVLATLAAGVPLRDPEYAVADRLALMACVVAVLAVLDVVVRAGTQSRTLTPSLAAMRRVRRERWTRRRGVAVAGALVSFYVTYLAYRNLKSILPLLRPGELFDRQLADVDRGLLGGHDPAALLHSVLGTGTAAEVLSVVYYAFFLFVPISLALALVFSPRPQGGIFYAIALSIDWALGAASYYLLPALGPAYAASAGFAALPATETSHLQALLIRQRRGFLIDPTAAGAHQGIAAFGSLHTAILFTAAVAAHMWGLRRRLRIGLWVLCGLTVVATVYLGWHYVVDDLAGAAIGTIGLALARGLTGFAPRAARRLQLPKRSGVVLPAAPAEPGQHNTSPRALEPPLVETASGNDAA